MMYYVAKPSWSNGPCDWRTVMASEADKREAVSLRGACSLCVSAVVRQAPCVSDKNVKPYKQKGIWDDISICEDLSILSVMIRTGPMGACICVWQPGVNSTTQAQSARGEYTSERQVVNNTKKNKQTSKCSWFSAKYRLLWRINFTFLEYHLSNLLMLYCMILGLWWRWIIDARAESNVGPFIPLAEIHWELQQMVCCRSPQAIMEI